MKVKVRDGMLVIELEMDIPPRWANSGKSRLVAGSGGVQPTQIKIKGKVLHVSARAFVFEAPPRTQYQDLLTWKEDAGPSGKNSGKNR